MDHLCLRCFEILNWKLKFGKYKVMQQAAKCTKCLKMTVVKPYRSFCNKCADEHKCCAKCGHVKPLKDLEGDNDLDKLPEYYKQIMEKYMKKLREISRKKIMRLVEKGLITW
jgi:PHP family Zn ribbon phosphoesterase